MSTTAKDRSQPLLRVPRDQTPVSIALIDGQTANAFLFVPPGTAILRALEESGAFIPVNYSDGTKLVAKDAIACITVFGTHARQEDDLPSELQPVVVRLRNGQVIKGELRWTPYAGHRRILDHLNDANTHIVLHDNNYVSYIQKQHIMSLEEVPC